MSSSWIELHGIRYPVGPQERALDALVRGGAPVRFSCRKGSCRSCLLQVRSGDPGAHARAPLPQAMQDAGFFLPCCADDLCEVVAMPPQLETLRAQANVVSKTWLAPDVLRVELEPERQLQWRAGQTLTIVNDRGDARPYSITTNTDDYFVTVDVRVFPGGAVSSWLAERVSVGDAITFSGPQGAFHYDDEWRTRPLLLVGTGTGSGAVVGIARTAVAAGHRGPIAVFLGGRTAADLYLRDHTGDLVAAGVSVRQIASREVVDGEPAARVADVAFAGTERGGWKVLLCGAPAAVEAARIGAIGAGADVGDIIADPFDSPALALPNEAEKLAALQPDPELWQALGEGALLTTILEDFYTRVYNDPLLEPFFHRVTKSRAIEKQFSFLRDVFSGTKDYFGEKPFNAHHWMVISDELFNHREALFATVLHDHGVPQHLSRRFRAMHERFRREIVKASARGHIRHGVEHFLEGYQDELLLVASICDSCGGEVTAGTTVRMHTRTGQIACASCATRHAPSAG